MATPLRWGMKLPDGTPLKFGMPGLRWNGTLEEVIAANTPPPSTTMNNKISATLNDTDKAAALAFFQSLLTLLAFVRNITPEEKGRIVSAANGRLPFSQQACQYAQQFPTVLPGNFNLPEFVKDINFLSAFAAVVNADENFHQKIVDTFALANSDAYGQALQVKKFFVAANFNGEYNDVVNHLGSYFAEQGAHAAAAKAAKKAAKTP